MIRFIAVLKSTDPRETSTHEMAVKATDLDDATRIAIDTANERYDDLFVVGVAQEDDAAFVARALKAHADPRALLPVRLAKGHYVTVDWTGRVVAHFGSEAESATSLITDDDEIDALRRRSKPVPGCDGYRADADGRRWYSARWIGLSE